MREGQDSTKESKKQVSPIVPQQEGEEKVAFCHFRREKRKILFVGKYIKMLICHARTDKIK